MPQADSQSSSTPPLPPGYVLDSGGSVPPLPPGYALDGAAKTTPTFFGRLKGDMAQAESENPRDKRPFGDVQDWWANAKQHPWRAAGDAAMTALPLAGAFMGAPEEAVRPINVRGPGDIASEMVRPRAYYGGQPPAPIPQRPGLQLTGEVAKPPTYPGAPMPEHPGTFPGAHLPEAPPPEVAQARGLSTGGRPTPPPISGALGKIPVAMPEGPAPIAVQPKAVVSKNLDTGLREGLGAPAPIRQGVKIRDQFKPDVTAENLPEGHTATQSSAVKSFKYDPAAKELHIAAKDGTTHVYGEVSSAQAEAFQNASSKGTAWQAIQDNNVKLAKISPNGTRTPNRGASAFRSVGPESKAPGDLTSTWKDELARVKAKGGR